MRRLPFLSVFLPLCLCGFPARMRAADKPLSGDLATVIRVANIYVQPDLGSSRLDRMTPGRELLIIEHNGKWVRVFANTDALADRNSSSPVFDSSQATPPVSGWMEDKGLVSVNTPQGDKILYGEAIAAEKEASEPHAPERAAQDARLLYTRAAKMFPQSPLAPDAAWRAADIKWQLDKADIFSLPSAHEQESYLRPTINEDAMRKIEKTYPNSSWADLAAWDMLDNKVCGDWQGLAKCPEKEAEMYEKYADQRPQSPKAPEALYEAAYREAAAGDIRQGDGDGHKADEDRGRAEAIASKLQTKYPQSDYSIRVASLIYKVQQGIPIYGTSQ